MPYSFQENIERYCLRDIALYAIFPCPGFLLRLGFPNDCYELKKKTEFKQTPSYFRRF